MKFNEESQQNEIVKIKPQMDIYYKGVIIEQMQEQSQESQVQNRYRKSRVIGYVTAIMKSKRSILEQDIDDLEGSSRRLEEYNTEALDEKILISANLVLETNLGSHFMRFYQQLKRMKNTQIDER